MTDVFKFTDDQRSGAVSRECGSEKRKSKTVMLNDTPKCRSRLSKMGYDPS
ncbi:MAG: hypothetical protein WCV67_19645 [Victivallaceae bacterium]